MFKNPLILGALFGLLLNYFDLMIPKTLAVYLHYLGEAATPLSLLSVGAGLTLVMNGSKIRATFAAIFSKLVVLPFLTLSLLYFFGVTGSLAQIALLYSSVPCAGNAYILARQMGGDATTMAAIITWTTLLSCLSISLWMSL